MQTIILRINEIYTITFMVLTSSIFTYLHRKPFIIKTSYSTIRLLSRGRFPAWARRCYHTVQQCYLCCLPVRWPTGDSLRPSVLLLYGHSTNRICCLFNSGNKEYVLPVHGSRGCSVDLLHHVGEDALVVGLSLRTLLSRRKIVPNFNLYQKA